MRLALLTACLVLSAPLAPGDVLPGAEGPLFVASEGGEAGPTVGLDGLVDAYAGAIGARILRTSPVDAELAAATIAIPAGGLVVEPDELHGLVQGLLVNHGFVLSLLVGGDHPVLQLGSRNTREASDGLFLWQRIAVADAAAYVGHPALLVETTIPFEHANAMQWINQARPHMRQPWCQLQDGGGGGQTGQGGAITVRGTGRVVANLVEGARLHDRAGAAAREREADRGPQASAQADGALAPAPLAPRPAASPLSLQRLELAGFPDPDSTARLIEKLASARHGVLNRGRVWRVDEGGVQPWPEPRVIQEGKGASRLYLLATAEDQAWVVELLDLLGS